MSRDLRRAPVLRCLFVWSAVTAGTALLHVLLSSDHATAPGFEGALTRAASLALTCCSAWFWLATSVTAYDAARGARIRVVPGCPQALRRLLMTACGVALAASVAPAQADSGQAGLPPTPISSAQVSPTAVNAAHAAPVNARVATTSTATASPASRSVEVQAGDSLWALAEEQLGHDAGSSEVDRQWRAIWRANRDTVGSDPDVITPGQHLTMPEAGR